MTTRSFTARDTNFASDILFKENSILRIPKYQRPYEWKRSLEAQTLWDDLTSRDGQRIFIGCAVRLPNKSKSHKHNGTKYKWDVYELVDGQQRALTSFILLAALRDAMIEKAEALNEADKHSVWTQVIDDMQSTYFQFKNAAIMSQEDIKCVGYRLECRESLDEYFKRNIMDCVPLEQWPQKKWLSKWEKGSSKSETRNVKSNYNLFKAAFDRLELTKAINFYNLKNEFKEHFSSLDAVVIDLNNDKHKFTVFESINSKGKGLDASDRIKSSLLSLAKAQNPKDEIYTVWEDLQTTSNKLITFNTKSVLRYHWISRNGHCTLNKLQKAVLKQVKTKEQAIQFASDCLDSARLLHLIQNGEEEHLSEHFEGGKSDTYSKTIFALKTLRRNALLSGTIQPMQFLLALFQPKTKELLSDKEIRDVVDFLSKFCFVFASLMNAKASAVEKKYADRAHELSKALLERNQTKARKGAMKAVNGLKKDLKKAWPEKPAIIAKLEKFKYRLNKHTHNTKVRNALMMVDEYLNPLGFGEVNYTKETAEHFSPQNPNFGDNTWDEQSEADHNIIVKKKYLHALGNLTLLGEALNKSIGNQSPQKKLCSDAFRSSKYALNKKIVDDMADNTSWNLEVVKKRDEEIKSILIDILKRS